jgi:methyl-accepting chemotaxis protein
VAKRSLGVITSAAESSENIQKAIEVSDFLSDLVGLVGEAIDGLKEATEARFERIEKSLAKSCEIQETTVVIYDSSVER